MCASLDIYIIATWQQLQSVMWRLAKSATLGAVINTLVSLHVGSVVKPAGIGSYRGQECIGVKDILNYERSQRPTEIDSITSPRNLCRKMSIVFPSFMDITFICSRQAYSILKFLGRVALIGHIKGAVVLCLLAMLRHLSPLQYKPIPSNAGPVAGHACARAPLSDASACRLTFNLTRIPT